MGVYDQSARYAATAEPGFILLRLRPLLGLTLAVGIVIDDAIVVLENIFRHIEEKGSSPFQAAIEATREVALPVMATTLSLVVIFLPVAFMTGYASRFIYPFGWSMAFSILVSMFVSFTLDPMLSSVWHDPQAHGGHRDGPPVTPYDKTIGRVTHLFDRLTETLSHAYQRILGWSLKHKLSTLAIAFVTFVISFAFFFASLARPSLYSRIAESPSPMRR